MEYVVEADGEEVGTYSTFEAADAAAAKLACDASPLGVTRYVNLYATAESACYGPLEAALVPLVIAALPETDRRAGYSVDYAFFEGDADEPLYPWVTVYPASNA